MIEVTVSLCEVSNIVKSNLEKSGLLSYLLLMLMDIFIQVFISFRISWIFFFFSLISSSSIIFHNWFWWLNAIQNPRYRWMNVVEILRYEEPETFLSFFFGFRINCFHLDLKHHILLTCSYLIGHSAQSFLRLPPHSSNFVILVCCGVLSLDVCTLHSLSWITSVLMTWKIKCYMLIIPKFIFVTYTFLQTLIFTFYITSPLA